MDLTLRFSDIYEFNTGEDPTVKAAWDLSCYSVVKEQ